MVLPFFSVAWSFAKFLASYRQSRLREVSQHVLVGLSRNPLAHQRLCHIARPLRLRCTVQSQRRAIVDKIDLGLTPPLHILKVVVVQLQGQIRSHVADGCGGSVLEILQLASRIGFLQSLTNRQRCRHHAADLVSQER